MKYKIIKIYVDKSKTLISELEKEKEKFQIGDSEINDMYIKGLIQIEDEFKSFIKKQLPKNSRIDYDECIKVTVSMYGIHISIKPKTYWSDAAYLRIQYGMFSSSELEADISYSSGGNLNSEDFEYIADKAEALMLLYDLEKKFR